MAESATCRLRHLISHSGSAKKISEKSVGYKEKEKGQTLISEDLSSVAPAGIELLNLWNDFRKVVKFIDENPWVKTVL